MKNILVDTNIFLEILLDQEKKDQCKEFLKKNINRILISDFSLHSVGVILLRNKKDNVYLRFINDMLANVNIVSLSKEKYKDVAIVAMNYNLDFDDSYQTNVAIDKKIGIVTMDKDFRRVEKKLKIEFI